MSCCGELYENCTCTGEEYTPDDFEDVEVPCGNCSELVTFGSAVCEHCASILGDDYWDFFMENHFDLLMEALEAYDEPDIEDISYDTMLCCDRSVTECDCTMKLNWQEILDIEKDIDEVAYDPNSWCAECIYYYTPKCIPYRNMLRHYAFDNEIDEPISKCENFETDFKLLNLKDMLNG